MLWAREVIIIVEDFDLEIPLYGAVIRSWDGSEYICDEEGSAIITVPADRQVSVQITYPGYETGRLVIPLIGSSFTLGLHLGSGIQSRELIIEAARPGVSETRTGRSVAISGETLERSSQIGIIEDVMTSIKLLPGVGYTGMFNALPSIRGGDPGDLMAVLDGFYVVNPYHWGGGFSIFDPHMISSAQLSHGIFSTRYGHTISGLLELSSRRVSIEHTELQLGISTSAVNLNAAIPIGGAGGLMLMGKVTYWDPFVWTLKQLSTVWDNETLQYINAVTTAPYIRSTASSFNYRINSNLEVRANAFLGFDGAGADYYNVSPDTALVQSSSHMVMNWDNIQTFFISGLTFNPFPKMVLNANLGFGYEQTKVDANFLYDYLRVYDTGSGGRTLRYELGGEHLDSFMMGTQSAFNIQGRIDLDYEIGNGFFIAGGLQELFSNDSSESDGKFFLERRIRGPYPLPPLPPIIQAGEERFIRYPVYGNMGEASNKRFNTSAYLLSEYFSPGNRFGAELGLRSDHLYFLGDGFTIQTMPVLNPRLNLDFNLLRNRWIAESVDLTLGTGLFSSMNNAIADISLDDKIGDFVLKPNRSWTSVIGLRTDFTGGWSFNIEGYFKYVFNRAYQYQLQEPGTEQFNRVFRFNSDGLIYGFDLMLQRLESRYIDGWLSYTFTHAKYYIPEWPSWRRPWETIEYGWYFPGYHRFHNLNTVVNFKPLRNFNIYTRFGLASGRPMAMVGEITSYEIEVWDENGPVLGEDGKPLVITRYNRDAFYSDDSRTTWSIPLDVKFSYLMFNPVNRVRTELYIAIENLLSLVYVAQANTSFNQYTGQENTGSDSANYELPVPMVSVGIRWSF